MNNLPPNGSLPSFIFSSWGNGYTTMGLPSTFETASLPLEVLDRLRRQKWESEHPGVPFPAPPPLSPEQKKERELDEREAELNQRERAVGQREQSLSARESVVAQHEWALARSRQESATSGAWALFHLRPGAPLEVVEATYRVLSRKYHPDANPNNPAALAKMQALNAAIDQIRREAGR